MEGWWWVGGATGEKRQRGRRAPGLRAANVVLVTDGALLHSPSHTFSPFVSLLALPPLPLSHGVFYLPLPSLLSLPFFLPSLRSWWLSWRLTQPSRTWMRNCFYCTC